MLPIDGESLHISKVRLPAFYPVWSSQGDKIVFPDNKDLLIGLGKIKIEDKFVNYQNQKLPIFFARWRLQKNHTPNIILLQGKTQPSNLHIQKSKDAYKMSV